MQVAVGCPVRNRAWIFPKWEEHIRAAFAKADLEPIWIFAIGIGPNGDDGTQALVTDIFKTGRGLWTEIAEPQIRDRRHWDKERYEQMVNCRNRLLELVQIAQPDYFLSIDSDILLHEDGLLTLLDTISTPRTIRGYETKFDAVGGKTFLSTSNADITTYANLTRHGSLSRKDSSGVFPVDVLMAVKLMSPAAYYVPYAYNQFGEDIGWSLNCTNSGLALGWDGRVVSKHVMEKEHINRVDPRIGW